MSTETLKTMTIVYMSIILFISLAITSFYNAYSFWDFDLKQLRGGLYIRAKFLFFIVLGISACLDLPQYFNCWYHDFPYFCVENSKAYQAGFCLHAISTCGYLYCIITPAILWNDIILFKDGNLFFSTSSLDDTKIFFRICFVVFCIIVIGLVIGDIVYVSTTDVYRSSTKLKYNNPYLNNDKAAAVTFCVLPTILFVVVSSCLWSGLRLHFYIIKEQLGVKLAITSKQHMVLIYWNVINLLLTCSYFLTVLIILGKWNKMPLSYQQDFQAITNHFDIWIPLTQWLPFIFCAFCQIRGMQYKRFQAIETYAESARNSTTSAYRNSTASINDTDSPIHISALNIQSASAESGDGHDLNSFSRQRGSCGGDDQPMDRFFSTDAFRTSSNSTPLLFLKAMNEA